jgi:hypothetical protein
MVMNSDKKDSTNCIELEKTSPNQMDDFAVMEKVIFQPYEKMNTNTVSVNTQDLLNDIEQINKNLEKYHQDMNDVFMSTLYAASGYTFLLNLMCSAIVLAISWCLQYDFLIIMSICIFGVYLSFGWIGILSDPEKAHYGWIRKIVAKSKNLLGKEKKYEQYVLTVKEKINQKQFQHSYLAHMQLNIKNIEENLLSLQKNNNIEDYGLMSQLAQKLDYFKTAQNALIKAWTGNYVVSEIVKTILQNEHSFKEVNDWFADGNAETQCHQKKFMQEHNQFLKEQGLTHVLDNNISPETIKSLL